MKKLILLLPLLLCRCSISQNYIMETKQALFFMELSIEEVIRSKDTQKTLKSYRVENDTLWFSEELKGRYRANHTDQVVLRPKQIERLHLFVERSQDLFNKKVILPDIKGTHMDRHLVIHLQLQKDGTEAEILVKGMHSQLYKELEYLTLATLEERLVNYLNQNRLLSEK